ncbi:transducin beta-like protein 2 [Mytilus trossulus]|uniref:transducin beta-like protein 2 n=1 Tax=Mytilus trossulus TaxID=6551 RepID=UPI003004D6EB
MADSVENSVPALAVTAAVGAVVLLFVLLCSVGRRADKKEEDDQKTESEEKKVNKTEKQTKKSKPAQRHKRIQHVPFSHAWLATILRGHSSPVLDFDFSPNGKYLISTAEDRSAMLWSTKEFSKKEHKFIRGNIELDHGTRVKFSPDSKAFIVCLGNANTARILRIGKKDDGSPGNITAALDFPKKHTAEIIQIGIASSGRFIMTCSRDTTLIVWSIKGEVLSILDTHQMNNVYAAVSPCGRFVASSGFTPDVKVWEVIFDKGGGFKDVKRAFELKGHSSGVNCFSFNSDSSRMASVSKDGTWKYWDTNIRYELSQDPYLLTTGSIHCEIPSHITLSPDGRSIAVGGDNSIGFYNAVSGEEEEVLKNIHDGFITELSFDLSNKYLVSSGDKHIVILHNITGYRATISDLESSEIKATTQAQKERVRQQIAEARSSLESILGTANGHAESK